MASRVGHSPDPPEIKILPNSQTKLLNDRNSQPEFPVNFSFFDTIENYCGSGAQVSSTEEEAHG
uniref:Uncharacterized protein n=1 Tax=Gasterosteus aculeatus TaxID=69293 RepID=G3N8D7_GASAC